MNRLANERSAYLRNAARQKIDWHPWSQEAFDRASREDKPVFLSCGAIWCHWCHVMAKESFEDEDVAAILNERYVAVKLDRDERPDIDRRYQQIVAAMGQGGGWPLSVFLTPDKKPFFGGTYFPPIDYQGMPGFKTILMAISQYYREKKEEIEEHGEKFLDFIKTDRGSPGSLSEAVIDEMTGKMLSAVDKLHGGFGDAPKFPMSGAIEFLLGRCFFTGEESLAFLLKKTLTGMAKGGFHDQVGGGFHRYSTDSAWGVPHFEKMADDNAWLLRNYCDAYNIFGEPFFEEVARGIIEFVNTELSHPDGGFYASMDADVTPDDEGGYFTWTEGDFRRVLSDEEYRVLSIYLFNPRNAVHHDQKKAVLSICETVEDVAVRANMDIDGVKRIIASGKKKLLTERGKRQRPFIDTAVYTSLNGMMISAYCRAYRAFGDREILERAVKSLDRVLDLNMHDGELYHCEGVKAFLDDYIYLADALLAVYEVTGGRNYLSEAKKLMDRCIRLFWDAGGSGFFDTEEEVVGVRLKGIEDVPRPSANALAVMVLLKLGSGPGEEGYREHAKSSLEAFAGDAALMGIHGGYYFCALDAFYRMVRLDVRAAAGSPLAAAAVFTYHPYSCVVYGEPGEGRVVPCIAETCSEPIESGGDLKEFLGRGGGKGTR